MEGLKGKLAKMRKDLEAAETAEQEAKKKTKIAMERITRAEEEKRAITTRIQTVQYNLGKVEDMTDASLDQLERLSKVIRENECIYQDLDRKEVNDSDTFRDLELRHKSRRMYREEIEQRLREASNKLSLVEQETEKIDARIRDAENDAASFVETLNGSGSAVTVLAKSGECKHAKCDEFKEKIRRLYEKKEKMVMSAESLERKEKELDRQIVPLRGETMHKTQQTQKLQFQLREMLDEMNTYPN